MKRKKDIKDEINEFLEDWGTDSIISFLRDIIPLFELFDVEDENDWVEKQVGGDESNVATIRLIRTVYLVSRIAEFHAGKLCSLKIKYPTLWKRMELSSLGEREVPEIPKE